MNWQQSLKNLALQSPDGNVHLVKADMDLDPLQVIDRFQPFATAVLTSGVRTFAFPSAQTAHEFRNYYSGDIAE